MRKTWVAVAVSLLVGVAAGALLFRSSAPPATKPGERKVLYYRDPMNPQITSPAPKKSSDGMDYVPVYAGDGEGEAGAQAAGEAKRGVRIDPRMMQASGVRVEEVKTRQMSRLIRAVGQVTYDERLLYNLNAKFMGWVEKLHVDYTGKLVRKGDPLLEIYSPDLVQRGGVSPRAAPPEGAPGEQRRRGPRPRGRARAELAPAPALLRHPLARDR